MAISRKKPRAPRACHSVMPRYLAYHEAGHVVARLALDLTAPCPAPYIRRVFLRPPEAWTTRFIDDTGCDYGQLQGMMEAKPRALWGSPWWGDLEIAGMPKKQQAELVALTQADV